MDEKSIPLTAFLTPKGIAAWTVMPFGFKNAPPVYMRIVDQAMSGLVRTGASVDDTARGSCDKAGIPDDIRCIL